LPNLRKKLLEHRAQFQDRAYLSVGHERAHAIAFTIELPRNNRCARLAALAFFPANTSFASLTAAAWPALSAQQLPAVTGTRSRTIAASEAYPIGMRRGMRGIAARLPKRAGMRDDIVFVVYAPDKIFFDVR
jgi:hypothetical protein